jgi:hypothetical protein
VDRLQPTWGKNQAEANLAIQVKNEEKKPDWPGTGWDMAGGGGGRYGATPARLAGKTRLKRGLVTRFKPIELQSCQSYSSKLIFRPFLVPTQAALARHAPLQASNLCFHSLFISHNMSHAVSRPLLFRRQHRPFF